MIENKRSMSAKKSMVKTLKIFTIRAGGTLICFFSLVWMPWSWRVAWARLVYRVTYVDPSKHPTYMGFIEETNQKHQMGKREDRMYERIANERNKHMGYYKADQLTDKCVDAN